MRGLCKGNFGGRHPFSDNRHVSPPATAAAAPSCASVLTPHGPGLVWRGLVAFSFRAASAEHVPPSFPPLRHAAVRGTLRRRVPLGGVASLKQKLAAWRFPKLAPPPLLLTAGAFALSCPASRAKVAPSRCDSARQSSVQLGGRLIDPASAASLCQPDLRRISASRIWTRRFSPIHPTPRRGKAKLATPSVPVGYGRICLFWIESCSGIGSRCFVLPPGLFEPVLSSTAWAAPLPL